MAEKIDAQKGRFPPLPRKDRIRGSQGEGLLNEVFSRSGVHESMAVRIEFPCRTIEAVWTGKVAGRGGGFDQEGERVWEGSVHHRIILGSRIIER